jgi:L-ascorbate metabolism protein UlaG (beta-lactamase superfamily)
LKWLFSENVQKKVKDGETYSLPVTPAQTSLQDEDDYILWLGHASWLIQINGKKIDTAILPIAAYAPRWFMKASHINPEEAMQAFKDLKAKRFIPMHYGTFDLSDEPLGEPEHRLKNISRQETVTFFKIGEKYLLNNTIL